MFEEYSFAGVYIAIQAVLTLYAQGKPPSSTSPSLPPSLPPSLSTPQLYLVSPPPYGTPDFACGSGCNHGEAEKQVGWQVLKTAS